VISLQAKLVNETQERKRRLVRCIQDLLVNVRTLAPQGYDNASYRTYTQRITQNFEVFSEEGEGAELETPP